MADKTLLVKIKSIFSPAQSRANITSGEDLETSLGKISKWFSDTGSAAFKDVPSSGNAGNSEVVLGNDSRLSDDRTPTAHNQAANTITAMTGYTKPASTSAIAATDTLNQAIGKLEKGLEDAGGGGGTNELRIPIYAAQKRYMYNASKSTVETTTYPLYVYLNNDADLVNKLLNTSIELYGTVIKYTSQNYTQYDNQFVCEIGHVNNPKNITAFNTTTRRATANGEYDVFGYYKYSQSGSSWYTLSGSCGYDSTNNYFNINVSAKNPSQSNIGAYSTYAIVKEIVIKGETDIISRVDYNGTTIWQRDGQS